MAVLQGAFILADKLCLPSSLSSLQKSDWGRVAHPVLEALKDICRQEELGAHPTTTNVSWLKKVVCVVWLKLLAREAGEDVETSWKENPFFAFQNGLPEVNHVVLLELLKSIDAAQTFANFLLYLPEAQICAELARLVEHMKSSPIREDDVRLLMEVWWELWKGRDEKMMGGEDGLETMFARQFAHLSSNSSRVSPQAAKRLKLDPSDLPTSSPTTDVLYILLHALKDIKDHLSSTDLCLQALSICLDAFYTDFLISEAVILPSKEKLHILSKVISIRERNDEKPSPELIRETLSDLHASHTPSQFQSSRMKLGEALKIITGLAQFWQSSGLLTACDKTNPSFPAFKLVQSVQRVLAALQKVEVPETLIENEDIETEKSILRGLLESLAFPSIESTPEVNARVTAIIISHHLDDYQNFALLFASEESLAVCDEHWMVCLEKNQAAFQQCDTLIKLTSALMSKLHSKSVNESQCRKLMKVVADIFTSLSLKDKNKVLTAMMRLSNRGFFGCSIPSAVNDRFEQELNMAFNCIVQGGGGVAQSNLNTAVSLVARVAFQNPEAALRACCHSAVFNKHGFALIAKILQQLPGLIGPGERKDEAQSDEEDRQEAMETVDEGKDAVRGGSVLCSCLQEMIKNKPLSASEKEQLLKYLGLLMMPVVAVEGEEGKQSFLPPQEVVNMFVLPNLSSAGKCNVMSTLKQRVWLNLDFYVYRQHLIVVLIAAVC